MVKEDIDYVNCCCFNLLTLPLTIKIKGNQTIFLDFRCDGIKNCDDGSDEVNCVCPTGKFRGSLGYCISNVTDFVANRYCHTKADNLTCVVQCNANQFRCSSAKCIDKSKCCDGVDDCGYSIDEWTSDCPAKKAQMEASKSVKCPTGQLPCYTKSLDQNGYHCARNYEECFHAHECEIDGCNYNTPCPPDKFKCYDAPCLEKKFLCDGKWHCQGGVDESPVACKFKVSDPFQPATLKRSTAGAILIYIFSLLLVFLIGGQLYRTLHKKRYRDDFQKFNMRKKSSIKSLDAVKSKSDDQKLPSTIESESKDLVITVSKSSPVTKSASKSLAAFKSTASFKSATSFNSPGFKSATSLKYAPVLKSTPVLKSPSGSKLAAVLKSPPVPASPQFLKSSSKLASILKPTPGSKSTTNLNSPPGTKSATVLKSTPVLKSPSGSKLAAVLKYAPVLKSSTGSKSATNLKSPPVLQAAPVPKSLPVSKSKSKLINNRPNDHV